MANFGDYQIDIKLLKLLAKGEEGQVPRSYHAAMRRGVRDKYLKLQESDLGGLAVSIILKGMRLLEWVRKRDGLQNLR